MLDASGVPVDDPATGNDNGDVLEKIQSFMTFMDLMKANGLLPEELRKKKKKGNMAALAQNPASTSPAPAVPLVATTSNPENTLMSETVIEAPLDLTEAFADAAEGTTDAAAPLNAHHAAEPVNAHGLTVVSRARTVTPSPGSQEIVRLRAEVEDLQNSLKVSQERALDLQIALDEKESAYATLSLRYEEQVALIQALRQQIANTASTNGAVVNTAILPTYDLQSLPRDQNNVVIVPATLDQDHLFGKKALEAFTYMTTTASTWRLRFYPSWPDLREMMAEKYAEAGVTWDMFYYVICNFPAKENIAMQKVFEKRSNYNSDIKTYGRGPGGCVAESKWKELADEGVAPTTTTAEWTLYFMHVRFGSKWHFCIVSSRPFANRSFELVLLRGFGSKKATAIMVKIPLVGYACNVVEWPLANARGRANPSLDTSETVNQQNVELKISHVVTWIKETYENGDRGIWDPVAPDGFRMSPDVKILIEGYESQIFPNGLP
ncbi:unnamed protein product [Closterium sp. Yama58-4]|nr:unnamed protein product [Closterium sp. Yama58-4]